VPDGKKSCRCASFTRIIRSTIKIIQYGVVVGIVGQLFGFRPLDNRRLILVHSADDGGGL